MVEGMDAVAGMPQGLVASGCSIAKGIKVLARTTSPEFFCMNCQSPATQLCVECFWEGEGKGLLCGNCAAKHECDEEMFLPMVNSP